MNDKFIETIKVDCEWDDQVVIFIVEYLESKGFVKEKKPLDDYPECSWYDKFNFDYSMDYKDIKLRVKVRTNYNHYISTCVSFETDINDKNEMIIFRELNEINKLKADYGIIKKNEVCIISKKDFNSKDDFKVGNEWKLCVDRCILEAKRVYFRIKNPTAADEEILLMAKGWR